MVIRRRKSVWFLLGAALYVLVILLGLGNMVASLASVTDKELPVYSVQRDEPLVALTFNCAWEENDIPQLLDLLEKEKIKAAQRSAGLLKNTATVWCLSSSFLTIRKS